MLAAIGPICKAEAFKNCGLALAHAAHGVLRHNMEVSFSSRVSPQLLNLSLVKVYDVAACNGKVCFNLKLILVRFGTLYVLKVVPVLNTTDLVV